MTFPYRHIVRKVGSSCVAAIVVLTFFTIQVGNPGNLAFGFQDAQENATANKDESKSEVNSDLEVGLEEIDQKSVTSTISFLASDELAGRDTPSIGLTIASSYVASRFRGAGLKGGGKEGSFYQYATIATSKSPKNVTLVHEGKPIEHLGLYSGSSRAIEIEGDVTTIDIDADTDAAELSEIVSVDLPELGDRRAQFQFSRKLRTIFGKGAKVILVQVDSTSPLVSTANKNLNPHLSNRRRRSAGPILLVPKTKFIGKCQINIPKDIHGETKVRNVIGVINGSDPELSKEAVIYSAHLDHVGERSGAKDNVFNGADDNATGVTAVLSLADAFAALKVKPTRTVIFMTFWGEEKGLLGSRHFVSNPTWPLEKIVANINIEMIGRPEGGAHEKCWMTGWGKSNLGELMKVDAKKVGIEIFEHPKFSEMLYRASDNAAFAQKGIVAHSFSAGSLHADYHQVGDEWQKLEIRHMTKVIKGLFVGSFAIANGKVTPKASK